MPLGDLASTQPPETLHLYNTCLSMHTYLWWQGFCGDNLNVFIQPMPSCITHPYKSGLAEAWLQGSFLSNEHSMVLLSASSHVWENEQHLMHRKNRAAQA